MTPTIWDMHVHLDFMHNAQEVAHEAAQLGLGMLAVTVTPEGFRRASTLSGEPNVRVGVGLHPWWVADGRCGSDDIAQVVELVAGARYVGEIGLDLSPRHVPEESLGVQLDAFRTIVRRAAETSDAKAPKVLSIHSVQTAGVTLDALEQTGRLTACRCIFHWFSGTSDELHRAVKAGCLFSVNEMMLRTRRGREYARQLPSDRLLLETDLPPGEDVEFSAAAILDSLRRTTTRLAEIRGTQASAIEQLTTANAQRLLY